MKSEAKFTKTQRCGVTFLDTLAAFFITALIVSLLLPAIQAARESSRRLTCLNNIRNLGIASIASESATRFLPGPRFNAHPNSNQYLSDTGFFVSLLPYVEQNSLFASFDHNTTSTSIHNRQALLSSPGVLKCPSTRESMRLSSIAEYFSGPSSVNESIACDYVGNSGCIVNGKPRFGAVKISIGNQVRHHRLQNIVDGTSNTLLLWESRGDFIFSSDGSIGNADEKGLTRFQYILDHNPANNLQSDTLASYKSYILSWTGFRLGTIFQSESAFLNQSNYIGQPCTSHSSLLPCGFVDGSSRIIDLHIDRVVLASLASIDGGEHSVPEQ